MGVGDQNENSTNGPAVLPLDGSSEQQDQNADTINFLKNLSIQNNSSNSHNNGMPPNSEYQGQMSSGPGTLPMSQSQNSVLQQPQRPGMPPTPTSVYPGQMSSGIPMPQNANSVQPPRPEMTPNSGQPSHMNSGSGAPPGQQNTTQPPQRQGMPPTSGYPSQMSSGPTVPQNSVQPTRPEMPPTTGHQNQTNSGPGALPGQQNMAQPPQRQGMPPSSGYPRQMSSGSPMPQNSFQPPRTEMPPTSGLSSQLNSGPGANSGPQNTEQPSQRQGMPPTSGYSGQMTSGPGMPQNSVQPPRPEMPSPLGQPSYMNSGPGAPPGPQSMAQPQRPGMPPTSGNPGQMSSGPPMPQNSGQPQRTEMPPPLGQPNYMNSGAGAPPGPQSTVQPQRPGMPPTSGYPGQMSSGFSMPQNSNSAQPPRPEMTPNSGQPSHMNSGPGAPPEQSYGYPGQPQGQGLSSTPRYPGQPSQHAGMPPTSGYSGQMSSVLGMSQNSVQPPRPEMPSPLGQPSYMNSGPGGPPGPQSMAQPQRPGMPPTSGYPGQMSSGPPMPQNSVQPQRAEMPPPLGQPSYMNSGPGAPPGPQSTAQPQRPGMPPTSGYPGQMNSAPPMPQNSVQPPRPDMPPTLGQPSHMNSGPGAPSGPTYGYPGQPQGQGLPPTPGYPTQPSQRPGMQPNLGYRGPASGPGLPPSQQLFAQGPGGMPNSQPAPGLFPTTGGQNQGMPSGPPAYSNNQMQPPGPGMPPSFGYGQPQGQGMPPAPNQPYPGQQPGPGPMMGPSAGGPNAQGPWANAPGQTYPQPTAQQQQKRLDPDQMPSAIGVMQEDQQTRAGLFQTNAKGLLPPLVTTKFQVDDQGNASPRFIRSTMYSVPAQPDMLKQTAIPFALVINPFESPAKDEQPLQWVDLGPMGPVRCIRCKAYMSPLMQFIDGGRRFQCLLCKATTEVPAEYFQHMDHTGSRIDKWERPELCKGSYEIVATPEYCRGNAMPKEPAFIFVIDVSYNNVKSGLVNLLCSHMKSLLESLPSHTPVGFITYNSKVHFFNIDPSLTQPQMVIVPDVADMFMPLLTGFLVPRAEAVASIDILMEQIPSLFADTKETESVLGPAIQAGMEALKASDRVGKLLLFHSSLPTSDVAPGKLRNREAERKLLGTDKEKAVLTPQSTYYNNLGQDCVQNGVSVDLYLFNNSYIDVATIGQVARITGGSVNKYTYFQADIDGPRVVGELTYHLSRPIGFDAVMRVRTSTGVRPTDFHGHYFMANTTDVEIAAIDSNKGIAVEIKHDDKLTDEDGVYIQVALLYTSIYGQRRLRIHNLALNTCNQMADLYRNCELDTITNFLAKQCISKSVDSTPVAIKEGVISRCAQMLATYRKHCANPSMPGQLILPECLKLLPLYINCVLRSDAVSGNHEITPDDRSWLMYTTMTMGVGTSVHYFYPKLVPIAGPDVSANNEPIRCSYDKLKDDSAFILENGIYIFLWIGATVSPDWLQNIFGVSNIAQLNVETITELPDHVNSDESLRLRAFIRQLRGERNRHMRLTIVRQKDKMEMVMKRFLIEDRSSDGQPSYVDFLCHMHKEIRALLNQ